MSNSLGTSINCWTSAFNFDMLLSTSEGSYPLMPKECAEEKLTWSPLEAAIADTFVKVPMTEKTFIPQILSFGASRFSAFFDESTSKIAVCSGLKKLCK